MGAAQERRNQPDLPARIVADGPGRLEEGPSGPPPEANFIKR